jgi:hypothetical protein
MKSIAAALVAVFAATGPFAAHAQSSTTREEVRQDLVALENVGYPLNGDTDSTYPVIIRKAEDTLHHEQGAATSDEKPATQAQLASLYAGQ